MALLRETGDEASVSLRAVAERVGVTVPSIYLHFADKTALMDAVCAEVFDALHVVMKEASADAPDPFEGLRRQGVAYVRFALANPEHYRIVMSRTPEGLDPAEEVVSGAFGYLLESVSDCTRLGLLEGDPVELGLRLWASAHGIASLLIAKPTFPWPPVDDVVDRAIRSAGIGLAAESRLPEGLAPEEIARRVDLIR